MTASLPTRNLSAITHAMGTLSLGSHESPRDREKTASPPAPVAAAKETELFQNRVALQSAAAAPVAAMPIGQQRAAVQEIIDAAIKKFLIPGPALATLQATIQYYVKEPKVFEFRRHSFGKNDAENSCLEKIANELASASNFVDANFSKIPLTRAALRAAVEDRLTEEVPKITADIQKASPIIFQEFLQDYQQMQKLRFGLYNFYKKLIQLPPEELLYLVQIFKDTRVSAAPQESTLALYEELLYWLGLPTPDPQAISRQILDGFRYVISEFMEQKAVELEGEKKPMPPQAGVERVLDYYIPCYLNPGENREKLFSMVERAVKSIEVFEIHQVDMGESAEANCCLEQIAFRIAEAAVVAKTTSFSVALHKAAIRAVARTLLLRLVPRIVTTLQREAAPVLQHLVAAYEANCSLRKKLWQAFNDIKKLPDQQMQLLCKRRKEVASIASVELHEKTVQVMTVAEQLLKQKPCSPIQSSLLKGFFYSIEHYFHQKGKEFSSNKVK